MRWVILADDWPPQRGGVATWGYGAALGLAEAGCAVTVFARSRPGLQGPSGVEVIGVPGRSFGRRGPWWAAIRSAGALARADAVLATTWPMGRVVAPVLARTGTPVHVVFHGSELTRPEHADGLVAVARSARCWAVSQYLRRLAASRGVVAEWLPSPVEPVEAPRLRGEGPWALVARATPLKGGERFARLVAAAQVEGVVVGEGPALGGWKREADRIGARVRFLGGLDREAVRLVLDEAAVIALLPRAEADGTGAEGLGLTLLEGMARGCLPVGCDTGGVPEAVGPGLVIDPERPEASAALVRRALSAWTPATGTGWVGAIHGRARLAKALLEG